jgi:P-type Ca2+ transporter type 2C
MKACLFFYLFHTDLADIETARTEIFFLFIFIELVIALSFRSMRYSIFKAPPHLWLILANLSQVVLTVFLVQLPAIQEAFGITMLSFSDLRIILGFGVVVFISMEVIKAIMRKQMAGRRIKAPGPWQAP